MSEILNFISLFISSIFSSFCLIYVSSKLLYCTIKYKSINYWLSLLMNALVITFLYLITDSFIRIIMSFIVLVLISRMLLKKETSSIVLSNFAAYILLLISELIFSVLFMLILQIDAIQFKELFSINVFSSIGIVLLNILILKNKKVFNSIVNTIRHIQVLKSWNYLVLVIVTLCVSTILVYLTFFNINSSIALFFNFIAIVSYFIIVLTLLRERSDKMNLQSEYELTIKNLSDYEKMLDIQRMRNHENDNNLISVRGMISKTNKEAIGFINSLISDKKNDDQYLILKTKNIPGGGLQGLIYQKLLIMKQNKITYNLEVSKNINKSKFKNIDSYINRDICTIVGVFLDNAIQEVQKYDKKLIGIYMYMEEDILNISISNNYEGTIDFNKMYDLGYTTKEKGHGYGLSLVREIVNKNKAFVNEQSVSGDIFMQLLKVEVFK